MWIIGHRGAMALAPENTLLGIKAGMKCADFVEVDVRLSHDGIPVVIHDARLDRTTSGTGHVNDHSYAELLELDAGEGERVPSLADVVSATNGRTGLFIEIKEPGSELKICNVLSEKKHGNVIIVSFHPESLVAVRECMQRMTTGLIISVENHEPVHKAMSVGARMVIPRIDLVTREFLNSARKSGLLIVPWILNSKRGQLLARDLGVDGFMTDDPCKAKENLKPA